MRVDILSVTATGSIDVDGRGQSEHRAVRSRNVRFAVDSSTVGSPNDRVRGRPRKAIATTSPELAVRDPVSTATHADVRSSVAGGSMSTFCPATHEAPRPPAFSIDPSSADPRKGLRHAEVADIPGQRTRPDRRILNASREKRRRLIGRHQPADTAGCASMTTHAREAIAITRSSRPSPHLYAVMIAVTVVRYTTSS